MLITPEINIFTHYSKIRFLSKLSIVKLKMAERMGFEPMKEFPLYTLSKRAPSTTRPPLQKINFLLKFLIHL